MHRELFFFLKITRLELFSAPFRAMNWHNISGGRRDRASPPFPCRITLVLSLYTAPCC